MKKNYPMALLNFRSLVAAVVFGIMIFLTSCAKEDSIGTLSTRNIQSTNSNVAKLINESGAKSLTVKMYIEGFYSGNGEMKKGFNENGESVGLLNSTNVRSNAPDMWVSDPEAVDYVSVTLYRNNNGALEQEGLPHVGILNVTGHLSLSFDAPDGEYFLKINHRNTIETWSSAPVTLIDNEPARYDFTTVLESAYGGNMINVGDGHNQIFAFFSGDISDAATATIGVQDGIVESQDYSDMENAVNRVEMGYTTGDITGDGVVESEDYSLMENNLFFIRQVVRPVHFISARMASQHNSAGNIVSLK